MMIFLQEGGGATTVTGMFDLVAGVMNQFGVYDEFTAMLGLIIAVGATFWLLKWVR